MSGTSLRRCIHRSSSHLEVVARMRGGADVLLGLGQQIERAHQVLAREALRQRRQPLALALGQLAVAGARRIDRHHHHVADHPRQLAADQPQVVAGFHRAVGQRERARAVLVDHRLDQVEQQVAADQPEHGGHVVHGDRLAGERHHLIERALRVAHAALGRARDQRQRGVRHLDLLGVGDPPQLLGDRLGRESCGTRRPASATGSCRESCAARSSPS